MITLLFLVLLCWGTPAISKRQHNRGWNWNTESTTTDSTSTKRGSTSTTEGSTSTTVGSTSSTTGSTSSTADSTSSTTGSTSSTVDSTSSRIDSTTTMESTPENTVMIIGGLGGSGTIELFYPSAMESVVIAQYGELNTHLSAAPLNSTHAFVLAYSGRTYYVNQAGGPELKEKLNRPYLAVASLPCETQMCPIVCDEGECMILPTGEGQFEHHSNMSMDRVHTLTAFDTELIAIGKDVDDVAERYNGFEWSPISPPPRDPDSSSAVKVNDSMLLSCGGKIVGSIPDLGKQCHIYNLENDSWTDGPELERPMQRGAMVVINHTVWSFGGADGPSSISANVQTVEISNGLHNTLWVLEDTEMQVARMALGLWLMW